MLWQIRSKLYFKQICHTDFSNIEYKPGNSVSKFAWVKLKPKCDAFGHVTLVWFV